MFRSTSFCCWSSHSAEDSLKPVTLSAWRTCRRVEWPARFAEVAGVDYGAHCRHHCYYGSCMDECLANCTVIDAAAARPLCVVMVWSP